MIDVIRDAYTCAHYIVRAQFELGLDGVQPPPAMHEILAAERIQAWHDRIEAQDRPKPAPGWWKWLTGSEYW